MPQFDAPINTNDQSLDRVLATPLPVLLVLVPGSPAPVLQTALNDVARSEAGKLLIAKVNTAENPNAVRRFSVDGSLTLIAWKGGSEQLRLDSPTPDQVSAEPVLVDFWAPWCGPCRMIAPTLEKLSREYAGKLRIAKLNVDENPRLAAQYNASSIPLLVVFKGGRPVQRIVGAHPEPNLRKFVEQALR